MGCTSWTVGAVKITKFMELEVTGHTRFILPDATVEAVREIAWLAPHFADCEGRLRMGIHSFVVETPGRRILVDTGVGNEKQNRFVPGWNGLKGPFLEDLAASGYPHESIDTVLCTHLHVDHVGWNTRLIDGRWVPTFTDARYLMGRIEFDHWSRQRNNPAAAAVFDDSVRPVSDAGLVDLVESDARVCDEISLVPTAGHSPGHMAVMIVSRGEQAVLLGDVAHHPCQLARLEWCSTVDYDPAQAVRTRRELFGRLAGTQVLAIGGHFTGPGAGRIIADGAAFRLEPCGIS
jgi:glyoxylase-like metal-dependent hydrolase (beta-lactamase superfamily II)